MKPQQHLDWILRNMFRYIIVILTILIVVSPNSSPAETRIMAIGDSITRGAQAYDFPAESYPESAYRTLDDTIPNDLRSYREHLHDLLTNTSCDATINWVGSATHAGRYPENHEGHGGWRADQILREISMWLSQYEPDIILLQIGTNDLLQAQSTASTIEDITGILNAIDEYEYDSQKTVPTFVGNMIPIVGWHATHDIRDNLNDTELQRTVLTDQLNNLVVSRQFEGDNITLVDVNTEFYVDESNVTNCATGTTGNPENMIMTRCQAHLPPNSPDGVHPGLRGDRFLAQQFSHALQNHTEICSENLANSNFKLTTSINQPAHHDITLPPTVSFTGSAEDIGGFGLKDVLIYIRDRDQESWYSIADPAKLNNNIGSSFHWTYSTSLPPGNYAVFVKARDYAGNSSDRFGRRFSILQDEQAPSATIANPSAHYMTLPSSVTFTGSADDIGGSGLEDVLIHIKDRDQNSWYSTSETATLINNSGSSFEWSYSTSLPPGNYTVFVNARDHAGNTSDLFGRRFSILQDEQAPSATIANPSGHYMTLPSSVTFTGSADDIGGSGLEDVLIHIKDRDQNSWYSTSGTATLINNSGSGFEWSYSTSLPPGNYAVFVNARDHAGNTSDLFGRRFTISFNN